MNNEVNVPEGVEVWWLFCLEHWDVRPVNEAAVEATKLRSEWPTDCDVVAVSDLPKIIEQARSQEYQRVRERIAECPEYVIPAPNGEREIPVRRLDDVLAALEDPEQPALSEGEQLRQQSKEEYERASRLTSQGMSGDEAHERSDRLRERAKRLEASKDGWAAPDEAIHAAWAAIEDMEGVPPVDRNVLAAAVSAAFLKTIGPVPALSEGVGSGAGRAVLCGLREQAVRHRRKEQEVRDAEKADRESGKLPTGSSYEATWNYHQGLWKAYEDAAERLRRVLPAPPPQAVQGEGEGDVIQAAAGVLYERAARCKLAGDLEEFHLRRVADDLSRLFKLPADLDCQPEKGGEG